MINLPIPAGPTVHYQGITEYCNYSFIFTFIDLRTISPFELTSLILLSIDLVAGFLCKFYFHNFCINKM